MVSACLIAACASGGNTLTEEQKRKESMYNQYLTPDFDLYYIVKLRKYYHFEPMTLVKANYEPCYVGSIYAPILQSEVQLNPVKVEAKSITVEHTFSLRADKCKNGVDNYIRDNLDRYTESGIWYTSDREAIDLYVTELNKRYNIDLDPKSLTYTNQFCWEVESDVR